MNLGETLREARERKNLTASDVAEATHIKVQTIEALERNDYSRIAAPIYAKGFIKLYAEFVELDPQRLIAEYTLRTVGSASAQKAEVELSTRAKKPAEPAAEPGTSRSIRPDIPIDLKRIGERVDFMALSVRKSIEQLAGHLRSVRLPSVPEVNLYVRGMAVLRKSLAVRGLRYAGLAACGVLVVVLLVFGIARIGGAIRDASLAPVETFKSSSPLVLTHEPPAPYLDLKR